MVRLADEVRPAIKIDFDQFDERSIGVSANHDLCGSGFLPEAEGLAGETSNRWPRTTTRLGERIGLLYEIKANGLEHRVRPLGLSGQGAGANKTADVRRLPGKPSAE